MSQTNLMKRTDSTRIIIVVTSASVAGIMVLGVVIYVLIRCQTKRKRRDERLMGGLTATRMSIPRTVEYAHSGDSFIQSPPLAIPESPSTATVLVPRGPGNKPLPKFPVFQTGVRHSMDVSQGGTHLATQALPNIDVDFRTSLVIPKSQGEQRRHSVASVYSNASLPHSQHSFTFGSAGTTDPSAVGPHVPTTSASSGNTRTSLSTHSQENPSKLPLKSILKSTQGRSVLSHPLTPPISPKPDRSTLPKSISSSLLAQNSIGDETSAPPPSVFRRRRSQPNASNAERYSDNETDEISAIPPSVFRRRQSQPNTSDTGRYSSLGPVPEIPSISESHEVPPVETSPGMARAGSPTLSQSRLQRKLRPEPLRLRPRENYASIVYARARGPTPAMPSPRKSPSRGHTFPPTAARIRESPGVNSNDRGSDMSFRNPFATAALAEMSPTTRRQKSRLAPPSPTWSIFRDSPGWV